MVIGVIEPALKVLEDQRVTAGEIPWYIQTALAAIIVAAMMTAMLGVVTKGIEG